jgi:hypothetical protein
MSTRRRSPRACPSRTATAAAGRRSASFARRPRGLITLADWLRSWAVTVVGMESTGDYWRKTRQFVNHYSFHIMDPTWGHVTIKISGHPPFGAQVILNGHEYVACAGEKAALGFAKEGNCFIHSGQRARAPGSDRRHLVRSRDDRAPEPGHRPVYLHRVLVLRAQHRPTAAKPLCLGLLDLPGRVQPELGVRLRRGDGSIVQHRGGPHPIPARRAQGAHAVRRQRPSAPQTWLRAIVATGSRDRATSVEPDHLQGPLRTVDAEVLCV